MQTSWYVVGLSQQNKFGYQRAHFPSRSPPLGKIPRTSCLHSLVYVFQSHKEDSSSLWRYFLLAGAKAGTVRSFTACRCEQCPPVTRPKKTNVKKYTTVNTTVYGDNWQCSFEFGHPVPNHKTQNSSNHAVVPTSQLAVREDKAIQATSLRKRLFQDPFRRILECYTWNRRV